ncbi:alpha/beta hydrolase [Allofranklinella schreckenbergeri]|uniref:Alpha/beta hydrolase n=1 Tax=Allofranklinella schreckenbergeri TaxID=1076744 RepID=A0A3M6R342_9BURK|nr:alpha/beta hydrolase [Allofranklinella schreckenbergeri]RMX09402.1 alpha/beta hydrolase [Allofranklinella schreckenbergeri]
MDAPILFILPGWQNSGSGHWQSRWEALHGAVRVQQHDWQRPKSGDWQIQLEEAVLAADPARPIGLLAHSLGCQLVARWASHSRHAARVQAALLVAPPDTETPANLHILPGWAPIPQQRLPFASLVIASHDDPFCSFARAQWMSQCWGSGLHDAGNRGHLNADSGLSDWPEGWRLWNALLGRSSPSCF